MVCKGVCIRYKATKPVTGGRYAVGQRRCQLCEIFINWEGLWCPCCAYRLRTKPRNSEYKSKLRAVTPMFGDEWDVFVEEDMDGNVMMIGDGTATLVEVVDATRSDFHLWKCTVDGVEMERFIKA